MKSLLLFLFLTGQVFITQSCNLSKTAVVRDTVKAVATTTPDFYSFYIEETGRGKLKDYDRTVKNNESNPGLIITMIPGIKQDQGYYIVKPAGNGPAVSGASGSPDPSEISIPLGQLKPILIPQRGN